MELRPTRRSPEGSQNIDGAAKTVCPISCPEGSQNGFERLIPAGSRSAAVSDRIELMSRLVLDCCESLPAETRISTAVNSSPSRGIFCIRLIAPPAPYGPNAEGCPPWTDPMGPLEISTRSRIPESINIPIALVIGRVPSSDGVEPAMPRMEYCPEVRSIIDFPPPDTPGWKKSKSCKSPGSCSRIKSVVITSTLTGSSDGETLK